MKKKDILFSLIAGFFMGLLSLVVLNNINIKLGSYWIIWIFAIPILSLLGMFIATLIGKVLPIIKQVAKFLLVGALNTLVDLGILNILILITGIASGVTFGLFKGISFSIAVINSYSWNKAWTFEKNESKDKGKEMGAFLIVSLIGFAINVGVSSFVVNVLGPHFGLSLAQWANVGAIIATLVAMTWNFLGFKLIVFKKS